MMISSSKNKTTSALALDKPLFLAAEADFWVNVKGLDLDPERVAIKINDIGSRTFVSGGRTDIYTDELNDKRAIDVFLLETQNTLVDQVFNEYIKNL